MEGENTNEITLLKSGKIPPFASSLQRQCSQWQQKLLSACIQGLGILSSVTSSGFWFSNTVDFAPAISLAHKGTCASNTPQQSPMTSHQENRGRIRFINAEPTTQHTMTNYTFQKECGSLVHSMGGLAFKCAQGTYSDWWQLISTVNADIKEQLPMDKRKQQDVDLDKMCESLRRSSINACSVKISRAYRRGEKLMACQTC